MRSTDPNTAHDEQLGLWDWAPEAAGRPETGPATANRRHAARPPTATLRPVETRTSITDPIRVDWIRGLEGPGAVGLTFAPGKRSIGHASRIWWDRSLDADLDRLRSIERADVLVTLLEPREMVSAGIADLASRARAHGLRWLSLPIQDGGVPTSGWGMAALLAKLRQETASRVVVHCLGGLGRAGLVVGCHLVGLGWSSGRALEELRRARGPSCPETSAQRDYIRAWAYARAVA